MMTIATMVAPAATTNAVWKNRNIIQYLFEENNNFDILHLQLSQQIQWSHDNHDF
jgi:hypothetical protein